MRIFCIFLLSLLLIPALVTASQASQKSCHINDIKFQSQKEKELIVLSLDCLYDFPISYHFDYGSTEITLPGTTFDIDSSIKINNRFLKYIDIKSEGRNSILQVFFADPSIHSVGIYDHQISDKLLTISISKSTKPGTKATLPKPAKDESADGFLPQSPINKHFLKEGNTVSSIIYMLIALSVVLGLIFIML